MVRKVRKKKKKRKKRKKKRKYIFLNWNKKKIYINEKIK